MNSLDGIERPTLASFKQASQNAMGKAKIMVGLKEEEDLESQQSDRSFLDEAADLLCPELTFQQVRIGSCLKGNPLFSFANSF
jgi:hypothetical protein